LDAMCAGGRLNAAPERRLRAVIVHVAVWAAFGALVVVTEGGRDNVRPLTERLRYALSLVALTAPPVYVNFAFINRYYLSGRYLAHLGLLAAVVLGWAFVFDRASALLSGPTVGQYAALVPTILLVVLLSSGIRMLGLVGRQRAQIQEMRARNLQAELDLLKAQVHPHFLFNTLNNLFGLARRSDPAAADGIAQLSHLLRYLIYESRAERVDLGQEADQIRRLVELEKLRFSEDDDIEVTLALDADFADARIAPMLLLPLVENAFKHGIRRSAPSFVRVSLAAETGTIRFVVENSLHPPRARLADQPPGIGLRNVRRRLELLYPGAHTLEVGEAGGAFRASLRLDERRQGGRL